MSDPFDKSYKNPNPFTISIAPKLFDSLSGVPSETSPEGMGASLYETCLKAIQKRQIPQDGCELDDLGTLSIKADGLLGRVHIDLRGAQAFHLVIGPDRFPYGYGEEGSLKNLTYILSEQDCRSVLIRALDWVQKAIRTTKERVQASNETELNGDRAKVRRNLGALLS